MAPTKLGYEKTAEDVILRRVTAFVLDQILAVVLAVAGTVGLALQIGDVVVLSVLVIYFGYFVAFEAAFSRTPGKRVAGIVVVDRFGTKISIGQAIIRNLLRVLDGLFSYAVGLVVMLVTNDCQRIGDLGAGTRVVRARR